MSELFFRFRNSNLFKMYIRQCYIILYYPGIIQDSYDSGRATGASLMEKE